MENSQLPARLGDGGPCPGRLGHPIPLTGHTPHLVPQQLIRHRALGMGVTEPCSLSTGVHLPLTSRPLFCQGGRDGPSWVPPRPMAQPGAFSVQAPGPRAGGVWHPPRG